jgi:hypothetical protein
MTFLTRIAGAAMLIGLSGASAHAGYVVELTQEESDVVATGSGHMDTSGLTLVGQNTSVPADIWPASGFINTGPTTSVPLDFYAGPIAGPMTFGSGIGTFANSGSADSVEIIGASVPFGMPMLFLPRDYASDTPLSDIATYKGQIFALEAASSRAGIGRTLRAPSPST